MMKRLADLSGLVPGPSELTVTPDEADFHVQYYDSLESVKVDRFRQFGGRTVYAVTVGEGPIGVFVARPHAHEPAATAASWLILDLLSGR